MSAVKKSPTLRERTAAAEDASMWKDVVIHDLRKEIAALRAPVQAQGVALSDREELAADLKTARATIRVMDRTQAALLERIKELQAASERPTAADAGNQECCDTPNYCSSVRRCTAKDGASLPLDTNYFKRKLVIITRDMSHYTGQEMARELVRLAKVADEGEAAKEASLPAQGLTDAKDGARLKFLHTTNRDAEGWEWGVARVRVAADGRIEYLWGLSDSSDIDAAIERMTGNAGGAIAALTGSGT